MNILAALSLIGMVFFATVGNGLEPLDHNFTIMFLAFCILYGKGGNSVSLTVRGGK